MFSLEKKLNILPAEMIPENKLRFDLLFSATLKIVVFNMHNPVVLMNIFSAHFPASPILPCKFPLSSGLILFKFNKVV